MLIANAVLADGTTRHIDVERGRIAALLPAEAGVPARDDVLDRATMIAYRANFRHDHELQFALDMVTAAAARAGHRGLRDRRRRRRRLRGGRSGLRGRGVRHPAAPQAGDQG